MATNKQFDDMLRKMSVDSALEWMDRAIANLERTQRDLKSAASNSRTHAMAQRTIHSKARPLSWFVNDLNNLNMNWRLDLVANHAAALALTEKAE